MIKFSEYDDIYFVAQNMRAKDKEEIYATRAQDDCNAESMADQLSFSAKSGMAFTAFNKQGEPVCVFGAVETWPKVWSVFMFATDEFKTVAKEVTKFIKYALINMITNTGAHRASCMSLDTHKDAHNWLKVLGASQEYVAKKFGKNGEDFYCFTWFRSDKNV